MICISSAIFRMSFILSFRKSMFCMVVWLWMLFWNGIELCWIGIPSGRVMSWIIAMPTVRISFLATLSSTSMSEVLRMSWSASIISRSGFIRASEKCRSAAAYPMLDGAVSGR
jgi:apolipoprotein N-acyltransferase